MKLLFTVCGRAGSKGVRNKNIKDFLGNPLPLYTLSAISLFLEKHRSEYEEVTVAINTDSKELVEIANMSTVDFVYVARKEELGGDTASKVDVIRDTYRECKKSEQIDYDYVIDLDLTSPLRTVKDIENAIETMKNDNQCDVLFSVTDPRRNPYFNMVKKEENNYYGRVIQSNFIARQQAPQIFDVNASVYVYSKKFMEQNGMQIFDGNVSVVHMLDTAILDIDSEDDFELMQVVAAYLYKKHEALNEIKENIRKITRL